MLSPYSDADDTKAWISEKDTALSSADYGRDLASVQALQRKHDVLERDLAALEEKVTVYHFEIPLPRRSRHAAPGFIHSQKHTSCMKSAAGLLPCSRRADIWMCSHCLSQLDDDKSAASCQPA